jgi:UDP-N-acetylmuramoylalanine-D-glutamate ligase
MLALQKYQNKRIAIYGMGITGRSTAQTLKRLGAKVSCWDDNEKIRKKIKNFNLNKFWLNKNLFDRIVISPGIYIN